MNVTIRVPAGIQTLSEAELASKAAEYALKCPSEVTCAFRIWYEDFEGYGMPTKQVITAIEKGIVDSGRWTPVGLRRFEKYGMVNAYTNNQYDTAAKEYGGHDMVLHHFHAGSKYQGPDGKVYWVAVVEVFDMRCFEYKDGKYVGNMVEINPYSDYAKAMVELK
jgi:hypothetical protein